VTEIVKRREHVPEAIFGNIERSSSVEMMEKVARALAYSAGAAIVGPGQSRATREFGWKGDGAHFQEYVDAHWKEHVHAAGFALSAMREPSEAMKACSVRFLSEQLDYDEMYRRMIDVALEEYCRNPRRSRGAELDAI